MNVLQNVAQKTKQLAKRLDWIPFFTGKNLLSVSRHNQIIASLNPLLRMAIVIGTKNQIHYSDSNVLIELDGSQLIVNGAVGIAKYTLVSHASDHIVASKDGANYNIAKPYLLRFSISSRTLRSVAYTYDTYDTSAQTRTAHRTSDSATESQYITEPYCVGDEIWAVTCDEMTVAGPTTVTLLDLNVDGRAWMGIDA